MKVDHTPPPAAASGARQLIVTNGYVLAAVIAATIAALLLLLRAVGFSIEHHGDIPSYLSWSHAWWVRPHPYWVPAYPITIWIVRAVTFSRLPDIAVVYTIAFCAFCVSLWYVDAILRTLAPSARLFGVALFALYPFIGIGHVVLPLSDAMASAILVAAVYYMIRRSWWPFTATIALALVAHKALWPFAALLAVAAAVQYGYPWYRAVLAGVPLVGYWLFGMRTGMKGGPLWLIRSDMSVNIASRSRLSFLDGVLGPFLSGHPASAAKGIALLLLLAAVVLLLVRFVRDRDGVMIALIVPVIALLVILNSAEVFAAIRYSKVLALPIAVVVASSSSFASRPRLRYAALAGFAALCALAGRVHLLRGRRLSRDGERAPRGVPRGSLSDRHELSGASAAAPGARPARQTCVRCRRGGDRARRS